MKTCHRPEWSEEKKDCYCDGFSYEEMGMHKETVIMAKNNIRSIRFSDELADLIYAAA